MDGVVYFGLSDSSNKTKKYRAFFYDENMNLVKKTDFGALGYEDYTMHRDSSRRSGYIARHSNRGENWEDFTTAGSLSRYILWEYPDLDTAIDRYAERFGLIKID